MVRAILPFLGEWAGRQDVMNGARKGVTGRLFAEKAFIHDPFSLDFTRASAPTALNFLDSGWRSDRHELRSGAADRAPPSTVAEIAEPDAFVYPAPAVIAAASFAPPSWTEMLAPVASLIEMTSSSSGATAEAEIGADAAGVYDPYWQRNAVCALADKVVEPSGDLATGPAAASPSGDWLLGG